MPVYAYGVAVHVRSIAFSDDDTYGFLASREKLTTLPRNNRLPLTNTIHIWVRDTFGLRFDTHGTSSCAGLPGSASLGPGVIRHQRGFSSIVRLGRRFHRVISVLAAFRIKRLERLEIKRSDGQKCRKNDSVSGVSIYQCRMKRKGHGIGE